MDVENTKDGGNVLLCRDKNSFSAATDNDYIIKVIKTNNLGAVEWISNLSLDTTSLDDGIWGYSIKQTSDSGYIITGTRFLKDVINNYEYNSLFIAKIDENGNILWNKNYVAQGLVESAYGNDIVETSGGDYLITGIKSINYIEKLFVMKIDAQGNLIWERIFIPLNLQHSYGYSIRETLDGNFFITGSTVVYGIINSPFFLKIDGNGNTIWGKVYDFAQADRTYGIPTSDGGYIVLNSITAATFHDVMKLNASGNLVWCKRYLGYLHSIALTDDNGFVLCGSNGSLGTNYYSGFLMKTDSIGNVSFLKAINNLKSDFISVKQTPDKGFLVLGDRLLPQEILLVKFDSTGFAGCNEVIANPLEMSISTLDTSIYIVNNPTAFINTNTITINSIVDFVSSETDLCSNQNILEKNIENNVKVFPNPSKGNFEIKNLNNDFRINKITVNDVYGKDIYVSNSKSMQDFMQLNLNVPDGIYFIHISTTSKEIVKKVIVLN